MNTRTYRVYVVSILICLAAGALGAIFTAPAIPTWYAALTKPSWTPPNGVFGPVWTILYICMGIALARLWLAPRSWPRAKSIGIFVGQLALNATWSVVFFGLALTQTAMVIIIALAVFVITFMIDARKVSRTAVWLFVPYLLWVLYAATLNAGIIYLN